MDIGHSNAHEMLVTSAIAMSSGVFLLVLSRRFNIPGIVLLLIGGFVLGPQVLGLVNTDSLGEGLRVIAGLGIGIILFEGGLHLDMKGYSLASKVIKRLLSVGVLVTWFATTFLINFIFQILYQFLFFFKFLVEFLQFIFSLLNLILKVF